MTTKCSRLRRSLWCWREAEYGVGVGTIHRAFAPFRGKRQTQRERQEMTTQRKSLERFAIEEHKHRFAVWVAGRAASRRTERFSVAQGKQILEAIGLNRDLAHPGQLPSPGRMDVAHRQWRLKAIKVADGLGLRKFTHGIAAKLINMYCKSRFVCGGFHEHPSVAALHLPVDAVLLDTLAKGEFGGEPTLWHDAAKKRWSKFDSADYELVIQAIRRGLAGRPLWLIEEHWRGYQ
jgi:hypothetical protein